MNVAQTNITNPNTVPVYPQPPSNIPNVEYFPPPVHLFLIRPEPVNLSGWKYFVYDSCPEWIHDYGSTCLSDISNTADIEPSPSGSSVR